MGKSALCRFESIIFNMAAPMEGGIDGRESGRNTLIIRHLPSSMNAEDKQDFLKYFGAVHVRVLSNFGRMKHTAFATFRDHVSASKALSRLHQLNVLGHTLVVEYAKSNASNPTESSSSFLEGRETVGPSNSGNNREQTNKTTLQKSAQASSVTNLKTPQQKIGLSPGLGIDFPLNPVLRYRYPAPTVGILTNVVNCLAAVPRFYTQVLHLMNKMNLPAPFGPVTPVPPLIQDTVVAASVDNDRTVMAMDMSSSDEDESEIESDPDEREKTEKAKAPLKRLSKTRTPHQAKKHKLQPLVPPKAPPMGGTFTQPAKVMDVFEQAQAPVGKRIEFRLTEGISGGLDVENQLQSARAHQQLPKLDEYRGDRTARVDSQEGPGGSGFGTFEPPAVDKEIQEGSAEKPPEEEEEEEDDEGKVTEFISRRQLKNRLPEHEIKRHPVFKRYQAGEPTTRLYLKNLAKTVEEKDLKYIYGRYVDWSSPIDRDMFTIQLMTQGRMKGQAFIGLPSEYAAKKALHDTNAFILQGKPIVVQFARSAKLKDKEEKEPPKKGRREI